MTPDLEAQLVERFAHLCTDERGMICRIGCGDGWYPLLLSLFQQLAHYIAAHPEASSTKVVQVKQKMGQLRVYLNSCPPEVVAMIEEAEAHSRQVCELTGAPGATCVRNGYYRTLCPPQAAALGFVPVPPDPFPQEVNHEKEDESSSE